MIMSMFKCVQIKSEYSNGSVDEVIESECDSSDISEMRNRVLKIVEKRSLVVGLPATCVPPRGTLCTCGGANVFKSMDSTARKIYMRTYYAKVKAKRLAAREAARITSRRSPRLALKRD